MSDDKLSDFLKRLDEEGEGEASGGQEQKATPSGWRTGLNNTVCADEFPNEIAQAYSVYKKRAEGKTSMRTFLQQLVAYANSKHLGKNPSQLGAYVADFAKKQKGTPKDTGAGGE